MDQNEVSLKLSPEFTEKMNREICRRVDSSIKCCRDRDEILRSYALQVAGMRTPLAAGPWNNSCQLDDPMTMEHIMGHVSWLMAATGGDPLCLIDAVDPEFEDQASTYESAYNAKLKQWQFHRTINDLAYNASVYPFAPCRIDWEQSITKQRSMEELPVNEFETKEVPTVKPVVVEDRPNLTAIIPQNTYLYPPDAQDFDKAEAVIQRMFFTAPSLIRGIKQFNFDKDEVQKMIDAGPTGFFQNEPETETERMNQSDGTLPDDRDGVWLCYLVWGQMPLFLENGEVTTPEYLIGEDFCWMCCPKLQIVFKFNPAPYPFRCYEVAHIFKSGDGRLMQWCIPQLLEAIQEELTVLLRTSINMAEFDSQPVMLKPESMRNDADAREVFPGAEIFFPGMNPGIVQVLQIPVNGLPILISEQERLRNMAAALMGAGEGITQAGVGNPMTATENSNLNSNSVMRRDLFLQTFLSSLARIYKKVFILWLTHMAETGETVMTDQGPVDVEKITDIADKFIFTPVSNSAAGNPLLRLQQTQQKSAIMMAYIQGVLQLPPMWWPMLYHAARRSLSELGERSVDQWLGQEPSPADPQGALMILLQLLQQAAQAGDPAAGPILQKAQEMMSQQSQGPAGDQMPEPPLAPAMPQTLPQLPSAFAGNGVHP